MPLSGNLPRIHLGVGELRIVQSPTVIETVLGSCVAAVFWSARHQIGAMCHGALPTCPESLLSGNDLEQRFRYVDYSIRHLVQQFDSFGIKRNEVEVKLFGGADVLAAANSPNASLTVGSQNTLAAIAALKAESLGLAASDLGGVQGRVIYFRTDNGYVWLRRLRASQTMEASTLSLRPG